MLIDKPYIVFLKYIIPSIFGLLAISSASIIDGYFVGNYVGTLGLASINIAYPIFSILLGVALMFAVGSSVIVSKQLGEKNTKHASAIFSMSIISVTVFSIFLCSLIFISLENIFYILNITNELKNSATVYLSVLLIFIPFLMVGIVFDYFVRVDENPNLAFIALLSSAIVNVVFDYILIVKLGYGLEGAAYATGISQVIILIILLPHFFRNQSSLKFVKPSGEWGTIFQALKNGVSEFINESSAGITVMIFNFVMIKHLGANGVAAYTIVTYFIMIVTMVSFAVADGMQPITAKHFGAKEFSRIKIFLKLAFSTIAGFSIFFVIFIINFPELLVNLFLDEKNLLTKDITLEFLSYTWVAFLFLGLNIIITSYLTSIHQPLASATISIARSLVLPVFFLAVFSFIYGITGIYMALPFTEIITFLIAIYLFRKYSK